MRRLVPLAALLLIGFAPQTAEAQNVACSPFASFPLQLNLGTPPLGIGGETERCMKTKIQDAVNSLSGARGVAGGLATLDSGGKVPLTQIPPIPIDLTGKLKSTLPALVTTQTTPGGSTGEGAAYFNTTRTGGYGQYGNVLASYTVTAPLTDNQFDSALTGWVSSTNLVQGQVFGLWAGANTPSSGTNYSGQPLGENFGAGAAIGMEVNVGNRWADFGLQTVRGTRFTVGIQVVPDTVPAVDGPPPTSYPSTFGIAMGQSVRGHKWWTGYFSDYDAIMPNGYAALISGANAIGNAPASAVKMQGYFKAGIDFSAGSYSGAALAFSSAQVSGSATNGTNIATPTTTAGFLLITVDGTVRKIPYYAN